MRGKEAELTNMKRLVYAQVANEHAREDKVEEREQTAVMFHFNRKPKQQLSESNPSVDLSSITEPLFSFH